MTRIITVVLSILILVSGKEILTTQSVFASSRNVKVIINGQLLKEELNSAFKSGSKVLIPLKEASKALKYKVNYEQNAGTIQLSGNKETIEFKIGEDWITINGIEKKELINEILLSKGHLYVPLSFFTTLGLVATYDINANLVQIYSPEVTVSAVAGLLVTGQYQDLEDRFFSADLKHSSSVASLQEKWSGILLQAGNYYGVKSTVSTYNEDSFTIQCVLGFAEKEVSLEIVLNKSGEITELELREKKIYFKLYTN